MEGILNFVVLPVHLIGMLWGHVDVQIFTRAQIHLFLLEQLAQAELSWD